MLYIHNQLLEITRSIPHLHRISVLIVILITLLMLVTEVISLEATAIASVSAMALIFAIFPLNDGTLFQGVFLGFSNSSLISIVCLSIVGQGLFHTGVLDSVSNLFIRISKINKRSALISMFIGVYLISGYFNNIPTVMLFIPIVMEVSKALKISHSKILLPLAYISTLGGMTTLIGSGTNILVHTSLRNLGLSGFSFYQTFIPAVILGAVGIVYLAIFSAKILPNNSAQEEKSQDSLFIIEFNVENNKLLMDLQLEDSCFSSFSSVEILNNNSRTIRQNDTLQIVGKQQDIIKFLTSYNVHHYLLDNNLNNDTGPEIVETLVSSQSSYRGKKISSVLHHMSTGLNLLGIKDSHLVNQNEMNKGQVSKSIVDKTMQVGDHILLVGYEKQIKDIRENSDLVLLEYTRKIFTSNRHYPIAIIIFLIMISSIITQVLSTEVASFVGASMMIVFKCLPLKFAKKAIDFKIVSLVVCALAMANGLDITGTDDWIANIIVNYLPKNNPLLAVSLLFLIVAFFTNILTNHACAVLFTPIAVSIAKDLHVDPMIFAMSVVLGANASFVTPFSHPTNLLVMTPGGYKFKDYFKLGFPLIIILAISFVFLLKFCYKL